MDNERELFTAFLQKEDLSANTVLSYWKTVLQYKKIFGSIELKNVYSYKGFLIENYKVKTVNLRIQALNKYLEFIGRDEFKLKFIKVQQRSYAIFESIFRVR